MKIKSDFITNSSSTNYLVFIPDNFDITKFYHLIDERRIKDILNDKVFCCNPVSDREDIFKIIKQDFDTLIILGCIYEARETYYSILDIVQELELELTGFNISSSNGKSTMVNVNATDRKEDIKRIMSGGWGIKHGGWGHESKI